MTFQFDYWIISQQIAAAKDPDASFFRKLDGFQQSELTELKAGSHVFAIYGNLVLLSDIHFASGVYCYDMLLKLTIIICQICFR